MFFKYLYNLSAERRNPRPDRHLGCLLAFVAGAVNTGGFLALGDFTSHMTGIVSGMADSLAVGNQMLALTALGALVAFLLGAATTAGLIHWARRHQLRSQYALSILLEAALLVLFSVVGTYLSILHTGMVSFTVLLLCYVMGLQNAIITEVTSGSIRTTHVTGLATDLGIELGKLLYFNRRNLPKLHVLANRKKIKLHTLLISFFFVGGLAGAYGFNYIGYASSTILAALLVLIAAGPIGQDLRLRLRGYRRRPLAIQ